MQKAFFAFAAETTLRMTDSICKINYTFEN